MAAPHLIAVLLRPTNDILLGVDPVKLLVQWIVVNSSHVPQTVDGQDDIGTLLFVNHHAVDSRLLTEEQEGGGSCRGVQRQQVLLHLKYSLFNWDVGTVGDCGIGKVSHN